MSIFDNKPARQVIDEQQAFIGQVGALMGFFLANPEVVADILQHSLYFLNPASAEAPLVERTAHRQALLDAVASLLVFPEEVSSNG